MDKKHILNKIRALLNPTEEVKLKEIEVGDITISVDGDQFEVGQTVSIKTEDGFIPPGATLDGEHTIDGIIITILDGVITDIKEETVEDTVEDTVTEETLNIEKFQSYTDYPESVKEAAQRVIDYTAENGWGDCGTDVGKQRANQLAKGEPISEETIRRMYSYLSRHQVDLETSHSYDMGCGKLMYDAWGGETALTWSESKIAEIDNETVVEDVVNEKVELKEEVIVEEPKQEVETLEVKEDTTPIEFSELKDRISELELKVEELTNILNAEMSKYKEEVEKFNNVYDSLPAQVKIEEFKTITNDNKDSNDALASIRAIRSKNK